jgi:predicted dehydrogenase
MSGTDRLRFGTIGAGFWSGYQLAGWSELSNEVHCVAVADLDLGKAKALANRFSVPAVYADAAEMLRSEKLDFVDVVTGVESHSSLVRMIAEHRLDVVCQKPMARSLREACDMVNSCQSACTKFLVNENWRWQRPIRSLKRILGSGAIGFPIRARLDMLSGFPVFRNQPSLRELDQFILGDLGSHLLDTARFLFGEPESVYCVTRRVHANIRGEDVATVVLRYTEGMVALVELAYAENFLERECFPQTLIFVEGDKGSAEIRSDYELRITNSNGTSISRHPPTDYDWADPDYKIVHSSIVDCQRDLVSGLRGGNVETTAADNLKTMKLVFAAYESASANKVVPV